MSQETTRTIMASRLKWTVVVLVAASACRVASGEIPPLSKEELLAKADLVVTGKVTEIKSIRQRADSDGFQETRHRLEIKVNKVTKGKLGEGKTALTATGSNYKLATMAVGSAGIRSANTTDLLAGVQQGWELTLYLTAGKEGAYQIVSPNGFEVVGKPDAKKGK